MEFEITISVRDRLYTMQVKRVYMSDQVEKYEVRAGGRSIVLRNDRPLLRSQGKRYSKPSWKLDEGEVMDGGALALTILAIEKKIQELDDPSGKWVHPKNMR